MSTASRIIARYLAKTEEKFSPLVDAPLEVPTKLAVESTLDEHPASSGFHEGFSQDNNNLDPCWAIVYDGQVSDILVRAAKQAGLRVTLRYMENEQEVITDVSLDDVKQSETDKAKAIFDKFADIYQELASKVRRITAGSNYVKEKMIPGYTGKFVIQAHDASHMHWDLRLQFEVPSIAKALADYSGKRPKKGVEPTDETPDNPGKVLRSWAIPKHRFPTNKPILATSVEDHIFSYLNFHGTIPSGYGAGTVKIIDKGTYVLDKVDYDKKYVLDRKSVV